MVELDTLLSKVQYMNLVFHGGNGKGKRSSLETAVTALETKCSEGIWSAFILSEQLLGLLKSLFASFFKQMVTSIDFRLEKRGAVEHEYRCKQDSIKLAKAKKGGNGCMIEV